MAEAEGRKRLTGWRLAVVVLAGSFAAGGAFAGLHYLWTGGAPRPGTHFTAAEVDARMRSDAGHGALYRSVKAVWPADYRLQIDRLTEAANANDRDAVSRLRADFLVRLLAAHAGGIARAPPDQLLAIARQNAALLAILQRDAPARCRAMAAGEGFRASDHPREAVAIEISLGPMLVRAARAGEARAGAAPHGPVTARDWDQVRREMERRSPGSVQLMSDRRTLLAAPPARICATLLARYQAIGTLPPDAGARAMVFMLRPAPAAPARPAGRPQVSSSARR
jgi:hypothetical protein